MATCLKGRWDDLKEHAIHKALEQHSEYIHYWLVLVFIDHFTIGSGLSYLPSHSILPSYFEMQVGITLI